MRSVVEVANNPSLVGGARVFVIDECHALSKATWQSLLKAVEEPAAGALWVFCTTEADKVPATIRTRCTVYDLKPIAWEDIADRLVTVVEAEGIETNVEIIEAIARKANGSMRQGLVFLEQVQGIFDMKQVLRLLDTVGDESEAIELARLLCGKGGCTWERAMVVVNKLAEENPESIRIIVQRYATTALMNSKSPNQQLLAVISAFQGPYSSSEGWSSLLLSLGTLLVDQ